MAAIVWAATECISVVVNMGKSKLPKSCENKLGEGLIEGNGAKCPLESGPTFQLNSGSRFVVVVVPPDVTEPDVDESTVDEPDFGPAAEEPVPLAL